LDRAKPWGLSGTRGQEKMEKCIKEARVVSAMRPHEGVSLESRRGHSPDQAVRAREQTKQKRGDRETFGRCWDRGMEREKTPG